LAESTVTFALSRDDEAERWLRVLREHGIVGAALRALGVPAALLSTRAEPASARIARRPGDDPVVASTRGAQVTGTVDVLFAVLELYGRLFDRALYAAASATRQELLAELSKGAPSGASRHPASRT
jgi:hypothetical protein